MAVAGPDKLVLRGPHLPHGHDGHHSDEFEMTAGDEVTFSTTWVRSWRDIPRPLGFDERIDATTARPARVVRTLAGGRAARRHGATQPAHPAADDARRDRRHRRGADHVAARGLRGRAQLGLPLLLAARRGPDPRVAARRRLRAGGAAVAQLAAEGRRRRPRRPADHVHRRRWPAAARARGAAPARLRRQPPGPDRQRRGVTAPERRARRGDDRARARPARPASRRPTTPGPCSGRWSTSSPSTGTSRTTGCGRSAGRSGTSPTPG